MANPKEQAVASQGKAAEEAKAAEEKLDQENEEAENIANFKVSMDKVEAPGAAADEKAAAAGTVAPTVAATSSQSHKRPASDPAPLQPKRQRLEESAHALDSRSQPAPSLTNMPSATGLVGAGGGMPAASTFDITTLPLPLLPTGLSPAANRVLARFLRSIIEVLEAEDSEAAANSSQ